MKSWRWLRVLHKNVYDWMTVWLFQVRAINIYVSQQFGRDSGDEARRRCVDNLLISSTYVMRTRDVHLTKNAHLFSFSFSLLLAHYQRYYIIMQVTTTTAKSFTCLVSWTNLFFISCTLYCSFIVRFFVAVAGYPLESFFLYSCDDFRVCVALFSYSYFN